MKCPGLIWMENYFMLAVLNGYIPFTSDTNLNNSDIKKFM